MSRTNRKHISNSNYREARKGAANNAAAWAGQPVYARHNAHGGMMLSSRNTGFWSDETPPSHGMIRRRDERAAQQVVSDALVPEDDSVDNVWAERRSQDEQSGLPDKWDAVVYDDYGFEVACLDCRRAFCVCGWDS